MKKILWAVGLFAIFVLVTLERIIGIFLEPRLEDLLSRLFGMPVTIARLEVNPILGRVRAAGLTFMNQPQFAPEPHLDVQGVEFDIDLRALQRQEVKIGKISLERPFYFIDRIMTPEGPRNNVKTWFHHMKAEIAKAKKPEAEPEGQAGWTVQISTIAIRNGVFIIHDRSHKDFERKFVFQNLDGTLSGFRWPEEDPAKLSQRVQIRGTFGEIYSAPFWIEGRANFSTRQVNFNLKGLIEDGNVMEHRQVWEGLPIEIQGGRFLLRAHVVCSNRHLDSRNHLVLKSLKVKAGSGAADKIWGYPLKGWILFLHEQRNLHLKIPVHGNITDPKFEYHQAFRKAFQEALRKRTEAGVRAVANGAARIAAQTQQIVLEGPKKVLESPTKIVDNLGKLPPFNRSGNTGAQEDSKPSVEEG